MDSYNIEKIVNEVFNSPDSTDLLGLMLFYSSPGVFKKMKRDVLDSILSRHIEIINDDIRYRLSHENYCNKSLPFLDEKSMVNFLIEECIYPSEKIIGITKNVITFGGGLFKKMIGTGINGGSHYIMFKALKKAISELFTYFYLLGDTIETAEEKAKSIYEYTILESLD